MQAEASNILVTGKGVVSSMAEVLVRQSEDEAISLADLAEAGAVFQAKGLTEAHPQERLQPR